MGATPPYAVQVPFNTSFPSYQTTGTEEWDDSVWTAGTVVWDVDGVCGTVPPCSFYGADPQPFVTTIGSASFACEVASNPISHADAPASVFSTSTAEISPWQPGAENVRPLGYEDRVIVPAAQSGDAGVIVVYVGRPWGSFALPPYTFTTDGNPDAVDRFYRFIQDLWRVGESEGGGTCRCVPNPPGAPICLQSKLYEYTQRRWTNVLSAASEAFSGTWAYESYASITPTSDLGDGAPRNVSVNGNATY